MVVDPGYRHEREHPDDRSHHLLGKEVERVPLQRGRRKQARDPEHGEDRGDQHQQASLPPQLIHHELTISRKRAPRSS